jgi:hypothetical protein
MTVKGKQIVWGTGTADNPLGSGILTDCSIDRTVQTDEITDEQGDIVSVVLHGKKADLTIEVLCEAETAPPAEGAELNIADLEGGKILAISSTVKWSRGSAKSISVKATHYPNLAE